MNLNAQTLQKELEVDRKRHWGREVNFAFEVIEMGLPWGFGDQRKR